MRIRTCPVLLACFMTLIAASTAPAQTCGLWLDGPSTPDFPPGAAAIQLRVAGQTLFALVDFPADDRVFRFDAGLWTDLEWDSEAFGLPSVIAVHNSQVAVASARVIGIDGNFNIWEIAVRTHDGSGWQVAASGTRNYSRETQTTSLVNVRLADLINHAGAWHIAGRLSVSNIIGFSSAGILYRFAPGIETFATSESRGCTFCLDPRQFSALASLNGVLYLAGGFTTINPAGGGPVSISNIAAWTGTQWQGVAGGANGSVHGLFVLPSIVAFPNLTVFGDFTQVGSVPATRIALFQPFTSSWAALGSGLGNAPIGATSVAGFGGPLDIDLVVAGVANAGGLPVDGFARWTGSVWQEFGDPGVGSFIAAVTTLSGAVVAGGQSLSSGGQPLFGIARWNGSTWGALGTGGTNGPVHAVLSHAGTLYASGAFTSMDDVPALHIARRTDSGWQALGAGTDGTVSALAAYAGEVIAAGSFAAAGGAPASNIAAWNGSSWRPLGAGLNDTVRGLVVWNNRLVAVGDFGASGGTPMTGVAQWDGNAWTVVDPAFTLIDLHCAAVHNNELYIGGDEPADVRRFTGGSFQVVGGGVNGNVYALASLAGSLYVGGAFTTVGANLPHRRIARWTGTQWLGLAQGASDFTSGAVRSLVPATDQLFVGGEFQVNTTGGFVFSAARWNGVSWLNLPPGTPDAMVRAAALHQGRYWIGGDFIQVGSVVSARIAQWSQTPVFASPPSPLEICDDDGTQNAVFSVALAPEPGVTLRWHKDNTPLSDGLRISGATTAELTVFAVTPADNGTHTCVATDACAGTTTSAGAPLTVGGCCTADFNHDGAVNSQDFFDFLTAFFAAAPGADFNTDGVANSQDFFDFLAAFFAGC